MKFMNNNVYSIFQQLNSIPRPSHHEERMADFLCLFAKKHRLDFSRDAYNNVVIRKPASFGCEAKEPVVLLNHMDMVAVGDGKHKYNPLTDGITAYTEDGWIKARGTSLGADNGIGLSMALAVLKDNNIKHGPLEVLTTTNEEDGMTGAANMANDFIKGRKVINLDSEDYDTITIGAAGAYIQNATLPIARSVITGVTNFYRIRISGGQGGHSGVDINKGRINAIWELCHIICSIQETVCPMLHIVEINGGNASASIPGYCDAIVAVTDEEIENLIKTVELHAERIKRQYNNDSNITLTINETNHKKEVITSTDVAKMVNSLPVGVITSYNDMPDTPMTSNNIGIIRTTEEEVTFSCHTRSFKDKDTLEVANLCKHEMEIYGAKVKTIMNTPAWQEQPDSDFINMVDATFWDVLKFHPRKVAMHFVLEAGYYVKKFPGIKIACIGPRIIAPHSPNERVEIVTIDNIYKVLIELLKRI